MYVFWGLPKLIIGYLYDTIMYMIEDICVQYFYPNPGKVMELTLSNEIVYIERHFCHYVEYLKIILYCITIVIEKLKGTLKKNNTSATFYWF